jgi:hypothetical protein
LPSNSDGHAIGKEISMRKELWKDARKRFTGEAERCRRKSLGVVDVLEAQCWIQLAEQWEKFAESPARAELLPALRSPSA